MSTDLGDKALMSLLKYLFKNVCIANPLGYRDHISQVAGLFTALEDRDSVAFQRAGLLIVQYIRDTIFHWSKGQAYLLLITKYSGVILSCTSPLSSHTEYADVIQFSLNAVECGDSGI